MTDVHVTDHHGHHDDHDRRAGHDKHAGHDPEMFRRRFWLSLIATVPLVVTSEMVMDWFGYSIDFPGMAWSGRCSGRSCSCGVAGRSSSVASPRSGIVSPG